MIYCRIIIAVILLTASASLADEIKPGQPAAGDKCPVCGMFVAKYPDFLAQLVFRDGRHVFFDGVKDMMKYYFNLPKYDPSKNSSDIIAIFVTDYYTLSPIDGFKAYYVYGSNVYGPMGKELVPFREESDAKGFIRDHMGKSSMQFKDINSNLVKLLD